MPEEPSPFYVPVSIPPIVVNSEATVKDTINVLIQWISKHSPKSVNQYAMTTSASTPSLSNLAPLPGASSGPSGALPPLPSFSPTMQRMPSKRKGGKNTAQGIAATGSIRAPTPPPMLRSPSPSFSSGLSLHMSSAEQTPPVVRSASADAASGLGGSLVAAAPRLTATTSAFNILREPPRRYVLLNTFLI